MADLIYTTNVSVDGFIEDVTGDFGFSEPSDDYFAFITELERPASTILYGRRLYESMQVWETQAELAATSEAYARFSAMWQTPDKIVFSTTLAETVTAKTRIERAFSADIVREVKDAATGHVSIGGANLAAQAFAAGLVDEVRLFVHPAIVGGGKPGLPRDDARVDLELIEQQRFSNGAVYLRHRVKH